MAEGVFRLLVERERLSSRIMIDSAGTHGHQRGERPDLRAIQAARQRGYELSSQRARLFDLDDPAQLLEHRRSLLDPLARGTACGCARFGCEP